MSRHPVLVRLLVLNYRTLNYRAAELPRGLIFLRLFVIIVPVAIGCGGGRNRLDGICIYIGKHSIADIHSC